VNSHLKIKPKRRIKRVKLAVPNSPTELNQVWLIYFMSDSLIDGRTIRTFNVIDHYNREALGIVVDISLPSAKVIRALKSY